MFNLTKHILWISILINKKISMALTTTINISDTNNGSDLHLRNSSNVLHSVRDNTTIPMIKLWLNAINEKKTEWSRLIGCYRNSTLVDINFTLNSFNVPIKTTHFLLDECIKGCNTVDIRYRYVGLVQNITNKTCHCYIHDALSVDEDCEPEHCGEEPTLFCGKVNETVVLYHLGGGIFNTPIENDMSSNTTCPDGRHFNVCTTNNGSFSGDILWNVVIRLHHNLNMYNSSLRITNAKRINYSGNVINVINKTIYCEIFNWQNSTNTTSASACVAAINGETYSNMATDCTMAYLVGCKQTDDDMQHKSSSLGAMNTVYVVIGAASSVLVLSIIVCVYFNRRKTKKNRFDSSVEGMRLSTINTATENLYSENEQNAEHLNDVNPNSEIVQHNETLAINPVGVDGVNIDTLPKAANSSEYDVPFLHNKQSISSKIVSSKNCKEPDIEMAENQNRIENKIKIVKNPRNIEGNDNTCSDNESEYNMLDHTLLQKEEVDNKNVVYDRVKPSILPVDRFGCCEYDSVGGMKLISGK